MTTKRQSYQKTSARVIRRQPAASYSTVKLSRYDQHVADDRAQPKAMSNQRTRDLKHHRAWLLAIASFAVLLTVCLAGNRHGVRAATTVPAAQADIVHFNLLGADWAKVPKDYHGVLPEKVVAELDIPKEYVTHRTKLFAKLFGDQPSAKTVEDIPIAFSYPGMTGAANEQSIAAAGENFAARIDAIIRPGSQENFRKGTHSIIFGNGKTREPSLDVNGLCGYADRVHPVYAGYEFYTACRESDQTFEIFCDPQYDSGRRVCISDNFLKENLAGQLFYQYARLKDHIAVLRAFTKLVMSFVQPNGSPDDKGVP
jgi:hypothetical protein